MPPETCLGERISARSIAKTTHMRMAGGRITGASIPQPFCIMGSVRVHVMHISGGECLMLTLSRGNTIWQLKGLVRALRYIPRKLQQLLVGERFASAGDTLGSFSADPLVVTLVQSMPACAFCSDPGHNFKRCGGCNDVYYCGPLCQTFDWPRHRTGCCAATAQDRCN